MPIGQTDNLEIAVENILAAKERRETAQLAADTIQNAIEHEISSVDPLALTTSELIGGILVVNTPVSIIPGWTIKDDGDVVVVTHEDGSGYAARDSENDSIASAILARFARAVLQAQTKN